MSRLPTIDPRDLRDPADPARVDRIWARLSRSLPVDGTRALSGRAAPRGGVPSRTLLFAACLGAVFGVGLYAGRATLAPGAAEDVAAHPEDAPLTDVFAAGTRQRTFLLPGGGRLVLMPESLLEVIEVRAGSVKLHLLQGRASVDATNAELAFSIVAGEALVAAPAGSSVSLARTETDVDVAVSRGAVEVLSPSGRRVVRTGEVSRVPIVASVASVDDAALTLQRDVASPRSSDDDGGPRDPADRRSSKEDGVASKEGETAPVAVATDASPSWLALAEKDGFEDAFRAIEERGGLALAVTSAQSARELYSLNDIASFKGKSDLRVRALRRIADEFPSDPTAETAASELAALFRRTGNHELAAKYGAQAMQSKRLGETSLCAQLGDTPRDTPDARRQAAALARDYLVRFPDGACVEDAKSAIEEAAGDGAPEEKSAPPAKSADAPKDPPPPETKDKPAP